MPENNPALPLLRHQLAEPSAFTAANLVDSVRRLRNMPAGRVPELCLLDFDGDLTDWLCAQGIAEPFPAWPCFHTSMYALNAGGVRCGIVPRTIGGPYAVLVAEQLAVAGARLIVGLTSAGRVSPDLPLPCLVVATAAIRDEGTSFHYLPPSAEVQCPAQPAIVPVLAEELASTGGAAVRCGRVWTTDAPYRETQTQLTHWANEGVLAVEMQAASLFAFATACNVAVAEVAIVSNAVDHAGEQFDTGPAASGLRIIEAIARAFVRWSAMASRT